MSDEIFYRHLRPDRSQMAVLKVLVTAAPLRIEGINYRDVFARETLINRRSREVVGDVGGEWPDTEAKRRPFGEVCPEDAPYFS
ncbi:hypothetical protein, partial [Burkholderia sp. BCC1638]|uniref:hypothetical protein n=1 Tax=Burkholderia sp. BCC1638 TaxID=2681391 RepID=UPI00158ED3A9